MAANIDINIVIPEHQVILDQIPSVLQTISDVTKFVIKGASSVDFPTLAARAGQNKGITVAFDSNPANYGNDSFNLDEKLGDFFPVNLHQEKQNVLNNLEDSSRETLKAIAKQADSSAVSKMIAAATLMGSAPTASLYDDLVTMVKVLDDAEVPHDERFILITNADYAVLSTEFKDFIRQPVDKTGIVGEVLGMKVVRSTSADLAQTMVYHKKGAAYAWHGQTLFMETPVAGQSSVNYELSRLFGCKATQSGAMIVKRANA